jgi:hypothetical protein
MRTRNEARSMHRPINGDGPFCLHSICDRRGHDESDKPPRRTDVLGSPGSCEPHAKRALRRAARPQLCGNCRSKPAARAADQAVLDDTTIRPLSLIFYPARLFAHRLDNHHNQLPPWCVICISGMESPCSAHKLTAQGDRDASHRLSQAKRPRLVHDRGDLRRRAGAACRHLVSAWPVTVPKQSLPYRSGHVLITARSA